MGSGGKRWVWRFESGEQVERKREWERERERTEGEEKPQWTRSSRLGETQVARGLIAGESVSTVSALPDFGT